MKAKRIFLFLLTVLMICPLFATHIAAAPLPGISVQLPGGDDAGGSGNDNPATPSGPEANTPSKPDAQPDTVLVDCKDEYISHLEDYYGGRKNQFSCSRTGKIGEKQILAQFRDGDGVKQVRVFTTADLEVSDVTLDINGGQLIVGGLLTSGADAWNTVYSNFQTIIVGVTGVAFLICALAFVLQFIRLGLTASNPAERSKIVTGIIWSGVGTAGCGSAALIFAMFFGLFG